jgi:hypothetical protein
LGKKEGRFRKSKKRRLLSTQLYAQTIYSEVLEHINEFVRMNRVVMHGEEVCLAGTIG